MLDRRSPRHPLMRGQPIGRQFETILLDGYTPPEWLRKHVARSARYKTAHGTYAHPLWDHLITRSPSFPERDAWVDRQLKHHGVVKLESGDEQLAIDLGLIVDERDRYQDSASPLDLQASRFMSLDGLLLLLLLYREAQDVGHRCRAARLKAVLYTLGTVWASHYRYQSEAADTWRFLLETRIVEWAPRFHPAQADIARAEAELLQELGHLSQSAKTKPYKPPGELKKGRGERRWRRRVMMRACCVHYDDALRNPNFDYRNTTPLYEWITAHRSKIARHRAHAIDVLMEWEGGTTGQLEPLLMPADLYAQRRRPAISEADRVVFGEQSIFDIIPVQSE